MAEGVNNNPLRFFTGANLTLGGMLTPQGEAHTTAGFGVTLAEYGKTINDLKTLLSAELDFNKPFSVIIPEFDGNKTPAPWDLSLAFKVNFKRPIFEDWLNARYGYSFGVGLNSRNIASNPQPPFDIRDCRALQEAGQNTACELVAEINKETTPNPYRVAMSNAFQTGVNADLEFKTPIFNGWGVEAITLGLDYRLEISPPGLFNSFQDVNASGESGAVPIEQVITFNLGVMFDHGLETAISPGSSFDVGSDILRLMTMAFVSYLSAQIGAQYNDTAAQARAAVREGIATPGPLTNSLALLGDTIAPVAGQFAEAIAIASALESVRAMPKDWKVPQVILTGLGILLPNVITALAAEGELDHSRYSPTLAGLGFGLAERYAPGVAPYGFAAAAALAPLVLEGQELNVQVLTTQACYGDSKLGCVLGMVVNGGYTSGHLYEAIKNGEFFDTNGINFMTGAGALGIQILTLTTGEFKDGWSIFTGATDKRTQIIGVQGEF